MEEDKNRMNSIWIETTKNKKNFPTLEENIEAEVCIVGARYYRTYSCLLIK